MAVSAYNEAKKSQDKFLLVSTARQYYYGIGIPKDIHKAISLLKIAADDLNDSEAMFMLAVIYFENAGSTESGFPTRETAMIPGFFKKKSKELNYFQCLQKTVKFLNKA